MYKKLYQGFESLSLRQFRSADASLNAKRELEAWAAKMEAAQAAIDSVASLNAQLEGAQMNIAQLERRHSHEASRMQSSSELDALLQRNSALESELEVTSKLLKDYIKHADRVGAVCARSDSLCRVGCLCAPTVRRV